MLNEKMAKVIVHKWDYVLSFSLFLLAYALRHHFLVTYPYPLMIHEQDAVGYMAVAKSFLQLHVPSVSGRPPGYPIIIALFALLPVGSLEYAARLASIFMDSLAVLPLYYIARIFLSRTGAVAVSLLWACFSFSLVFSTSPLSQSSYLCYFLFGIAFLHLASVAEDFRWFFVSGIFMALAYLARPEGIVGVCCGLVFSLTYIFYKSRPVSRKDLFIPLSLIGGFLLLAGPYLVGMRLALGGWTLSALAATQVNGVDSALILSSGGTLQKSVSTGLSPWMRSFNTLPGFVTAVTTNVVGFASVYAKCLPIWAHIVSLLGLLFLILRSALPSVVLLLSFFAAITPVFVVDLPKTLSYIYPFFVLSFICFGYCLETLSAYGRRKVQKHLPLQPLPNALYLLTTMLLPTIYIAIAFYSEASAEYASPRLQREAMETEHSIKAGAEMIKRTSQADDIVMSISGLVGYYADRPLLLIPKGNPKDVIEYGRKNGARFLLVDTKSVFTRRPELDELLDPLKGKPINSDYGIEMVHGNYVPNTGAYIIYRLK